MARRPAAFRQSDLTRAVRGVRAAGVEVSEILINSVGAIEIRTWKPADEPATRDQPEPDNEIVL